jgi:hypothetical protein
MAFGEPEMEGTNDRTGRLTWVGMLGISGGAQLLESVADPDRSMLRVPRAARQVRLQSVTDGPRF